MTSVTDWLEAAKAAVASHWATLSGWLSDPLNQAEAEAKVARFDADLLTLRCQYWAMRKTAERLATDNKPEHAAAVQRLADEALLAYAYLATGSYGSVELAEKAYAEHGVGTSCIGNPIVLVLVLGGLAVAGVAFAVAEVTHASELMIASSNNRQRADEIAACADRGIPYAQCVAAAAPASTVQAPARSSGAEAVKAGGEAVKAGGDALAKTAGEGASGLASIAVIGLLGAGAYLLWRKP